MSVFTNVSKGPAKTKCFDESGCDSEGKIATSFLFAAWMSVLIFNMLKSRIYDTSIYIS